MTSSLRQRIAQEIRERKRQHQEDWRRHFFNNLHFNLPNVDHEHGSYYQDMAHGCHKNGSTTIHFPTLDRWEITNREFYQRQGLPVPETISTRKLLQTPAEFFATIDFVLKQEGVDVQKLQKFQHKRAHGEDVQPLYTLIFSAYVRLREMGYSHLDLTS